MTTHDPRYYEWLLQRAQRRLQFFLNVNAPARFIEDEKNLISRIRQHTGGTFAPLK